MYFFARGHIFRSDRRENLHDGRVLSHVSLSLLIATSLGSPNGGGSKMFSWTISRYVDQVVDLLTELQTGDGSKFFESTPSVVLSGRWVR